MPSITFVKTICAKLSILVDSQCPALPLQSVISAIRTSARFRFGSDTIDPKVNKRNKVYSADAWTPTFPQVEYEVDEKTDARIYNKLTELKRKVDPYFADDLSRMMNGVEDQLNRNGGEEGLVKRALDNYGMKAAYLESIGEHANVEKKTVSEERKCTEHQIGIYKQIVDLVGLDNIRSMPMSETYSQYGDAINDIYPGASNSKMRFMRVIGNVNEYFKSIDSAPVQKEVDDPVATREAIDAKIDPNACERWVRDMYGGIVRGSGVYNGKEMFTPSGNRRSFTATHYPATVEGIVPSQLCTVRTSRSAPCRKCPRAGLALPGRERSASAAFHR